MSIGIFGGTFDPIHQGHLDAAHHVLDTLKVKRILFIPCYQPPHRNAPVASAKDRLAMLKLALKSHPNFVVNEIEIHRKKLSYSFDTLTELKKQMPNETFYFILGWDAFLQFHLWHQWEKIPALAHLIVVSRFNIAHTLHPAIQNLLQTRQTHSITDLEKTQAGNIYCLDFPLIDISATQIRSAIQSGQKNIPGLDSKVEKYIVEHGLYQ